MDRTPEMTSIFRFVNTSDLRQGIEAKDLS